MGATTIGDLYQLIYYSQPFGYDDASLSGILLDARRCNARNNITGALVCRHDTFLQLLEGPEVHVQETFERISQDDRHVGIVKLVSHPVSRRLFGGWAMLHDPATSLIWSNGDIEGGPLEPQKAVKIFENLSGRARSEDGT